MTKDLLTLEIRFLLARYGRRRVLEGLAQVQEVTVEQIEDEIANLELSKASKKPRSHKSSDELVNEVCQASHPAAVLVRQLAQKIDARLFLPTLHDVEVFLRQHGVERKHKSRRLAFPTLLKTLASLSSNQLRDMLADVNRPHGKSAYYELAHEILGKVAER